jgi:hypothetical protein
VSKNGLDSVHELWFAGSSDADKTTRDVFVVSEISEIRAQFQVNIVVLFGNFTIKLSRN